MSGAISSRPTMDKGNTLHPIESRVKLRTRTTSVAMDAIGRDTRVRHVISGSIRISTIVVDGRRELRVRFDRDREVKLSWKQRADGTRLTTGTSAASDPPRHNDASTPILQYAGDRDQRRQRNNDRRDRDRDRRDHGGCEVMDKSISKKTKVRPVSPVSSLI